MVMGWSSSSWAFSSPLLGGLHERRARVPALLRLPQPLRLFMLVLVLADNLVVTFVGWEGVGLCSYLLIGFWHEKKSACDAGRKAFVVNRIGDFGFLLGS